MNSLKLFKKNKMTTEKFTWVKTHKELVEIISKKRSQQKVPQQLKLVRIAI